MKVPSVQINQNITSFKPVEKTTVINNVPNEPKSGKKRKIAAWTLGSATAIGVASVLLQPRFFGKKVTQFFSEYGHKIQDSLNGSSILENGEKITKGAKKFSNKFFNFSNNLTTAKDVYAKSFTDKIPFLRKFDDLTAKLYEKTGRKMVSGAYAKTQALSSALDSKILRKLDNIGDLSREIKIGNEVRTKAEWVEIAKSIIKKRQDAVSDLTSQASQDSRFQKIGEITSGIAKKVRDFISFPSELKTKNPKGITKKFTDNFISEELLSADKEKFVTDLISKKNAILSSDGASKGLTEKLDVILNGLFDGKKDLDIKLSNMRFKNALEKSIKMEGNDLFDKMRDIKHGCAQMDVLSILGTMGLTGVYLGQAKSKQERVSVSLTSGIPLLVAISASTAATMKMISGAKAIVLGIASGLVANTIGKVADRAYRKHTNTENEAVSIPTIESNMKDSVKEIKNLSHKLQTSSL